MHEGIIDENLFEKVQKQLNTNSPTLKNEAIKSGGLLKGLLYDCDSVIYSPTYTIKKGKRYSYYISQNLLQYRDHPKGNMARIPSHEIEKSVTNAIKDELQNINMWQGCFPDAPQESLQWLTRNNTYIQDSFIKVVLSSVTVQAEKLEIKIDTQKLEMELSKVTKVSVNSPTEKEIIIEASFKTKRGNNGAIIIDHQNSGYQDPLDIPADKLKRVVRGVIWRDKHFSGATLKEIAQAGGHGENMSINAFKKV